MSTLWLYIPPLVLVATLIALVIVLGKKSAAVKKREFQMPFGAKEAIQKSAARSARWKKILSGTLNVLEKTLFLFKKIFQASETALAGWLKKVKEKRLGKKEQPVPGGQEFDFEYRQDKSKSAPAFPKEKEEIRNDPIIAREVIVRSKKEPIPAVLKEELSPEDKIREEALIHRIAENPKDVEAYREIGDYYLAIGNIRDAKDSFKMVLMLRPRDLKAKSSLREIEIKMRLGS